MDLVAVDALVEKGISDALFPGAAYAVWHEGKWSKRYHGRTTYCPDDRAIDERVLWDVASLSKVVATTSVAMRLYERGKYGLDDPVAKVVPGFGQNGKEEVTFRNLLLHDAGFIPDLPNRLIRTDAETVRRETLAQPLKTPPGEKMVYSDLGMISLAFALEQIEDEPFVSMVTDEVFRPLGMCDTGYSPWAKGERERCAPTSTVEPWRSDIRRMRLGNFGAARVFGDNPTYIQGEVHDPTAFVLGGVAGHAGVFSTLDDLSRFVQSLMEGRVAKPETVELFIKRNSEKSSRALGWDTRTETSSSGTLFGPRSFGHTGYTGTSIWVDPDARLAAVLLTNRVHPNDEASLAKFRPAFHDAVWQVAHQ
ncbi:class A beta-lactamase-related serine hydrolase [bacterium]|nr:MAG: class A beta-lactamase-related serine hydrolase [bacterium]